MINGSLEDQGPKEILTIYSSHVYLIKEKAQVLDIFKSIKSEVELQLKKRIKSVRSDRGGEYYDRFDGSGEQRPGPFAKFLKDNGIVP
jgi:hypothetical protein